MEGYLIIPDASRIFFFISLYISIKEFIIKFHIVALIKFHSSIDKQTRKDDFVRNYQISTNKLASEQIIFFYINSFLHNFSNRLKID